MSKIEFSLDANAYRITLNDPPLHILDIAMLEELRDALGKVNNDRHCLIITASGEKSFSAGASVQDHLGDRAVMMLRQFQDALGGALSSVCFEDCSLPRAVAFPHADNIQPLPHPGKNRRGRDGQGSAGRAIRRRRRTRIIGAKASTRRSWLPSTPHRLPLLDERVQSLARVLRLHQFFEIEPLDGRESFIEVRILREPERALREAQ